MLGYDLDLLYDYIQRRGTKKLVLALRDSEAFDPALLTDLLSLFRYEKSHDPALVTASLTYPDLGLIESHSL